MGNNNSSKHTPPTPKKCSFCHKESCRGDSCQIFYGGIASPTTRGTSTGVRNVIISDSVGPAPVVRSTQQQNYSGAYTTTATTQSGSASRPGTYTASATTQSGGINHPGTYTAPTTTQSRSINRPGTPTVFPGTQSGNIYRPGQAPITSNLSQSGTTLQTRPASYRATRTSANLANPLPSTSNELNSGNKAPESNKTGYGTNAPFNPNQSKLLSNPSNVSMPQPEVGMFNNPSNKNISPHQMYMQEQALQKNISGNGQSTGSTKHNSHDYFLNPLLRTALPLPNTEKKSQGSGVAAATNFKSTNGEVGKPKEELSALDFKWLKTPDTTGVKPLIEKPSTCASIISKNSSNAELVDETSTKWPKFKHLPNAVKYEGVVFQIIGSRIAKVRVAEMNNVPLQKSEWGAADAVFKYAMVVVDKLMNDDSGTFYPSKTTIGDVLSKGDVLGLICTAHNNPSNGFQLYSHEAWNTGEQIQIKDTDSVASVCSISGSDSQESTLSKAKKKRTRLRNKQSKEAADGDLNDASDAVNQWLDSNQTCLNKNENSKPLKLIGGCHYIGKVIEIRPPYGFLVEISSKEGKQFVFVMSNYFHPQGISAPALSDGNLLKSTISIGDEIVVIPNKNVTMQEDKFEWVASKAWPKNIQLTTNLIGPGERLNQPKDTVTKKTDLPREDSSVTYIKNLYPSAMNWKEFDGEILTLQYNWGLVKEKVNNQAAYVFTRDNTYLFGASLRHFILDDVLKIGQQVKFAIDTGEPGTMIAIAVWSGNKLPDYNSFDITTNKYCEENGIKLATEDSLIQHGKAMYLGH